MFVPSVELIEGAAVGFVIGVFCPAVCRKIKAAFTSETKKLVAELKTKVEALEAKIVKDGQAAIADAEKVPAAIAAEIKKA